MESDFSFKYLNNLLLPFRFLRHATFDWFVNDMLRRLVLGITLCTVEALGPLLYSSQYRSYSGGHGYHSLVQVPLQDLRTCHDSIHCVRNAIVCRLTFSADTMTIFLSPSCRSL